MAKQRTPGGVRWTDPTGRAWLSPNQHDAPHAPARALARLLLADPDHDQPDGEDDITDLDPIRLELRATDPCERTVEQQDDLDWIDERRRADRLVHGHDWADLDDPSRWEPHPDPTEPDDVETTGDDDTRNDLPTSV